VAPGQLRRRDREMKGKVERMEGEVSGSGEKWAGQERGRESLFRSTPFPSIPMGKKKGGG